MIAEKQSVEYLQNTPVNCTCTNLADHLDGVSPDVVNDLLRKEHLRPQQLWDLVQGRIEDDPDAFLIADDSVQDKCYSRFLELVKYHSSGAAHRLVNGIGVVNLVHRNVKLGASTRLIIESRRLRSTTKVRTTIFAKCFCRLWSTMA